MSTPISSMNYTTGYWTECKQHMVSKKLNVVGVIQARTGSSRLPGKVLLPLAGRSVLAWVVRAARDCGVDRLVVATTTEPGDDAVVEECHTIGVEVVRGPAHDVLDRFVLALDAQTADGYAADAVARFTADCPLLDPAVAGAVIEAWRQMPELDYVSTALPHSVPRGMDAEVVRADTLRAVATTATGHDRVHVTSAVYGSDRYRLLGLRFHPDASDLRVTLDTPDDWRAIQAIVAALGDRPAVLHDVVGWLRAHPEAVEVNRHVRQKPLEAG